MLIIITPYARPGPRAPSAPPEGAAPQAAL